MILLTFLVPALRNPPAAPPTTMTTTVHPPKPSIRYPRPRRSARDSHPGKDKRPGLKDVSRRKSTPRTAKKKPKKTKSLVPSMARIIAKAADGKPVAGRSPTKVDQALRERSLPEDHILAIYALVNSPNPHESKNNTTNKNPSSQDPRHSASPSSLILAFPNPPSTNDPPLPLQTHIQSLSLSPPP